jgi:hypothetical protein
VHAFGQQTSVERPEPRAARIVNTIGLEMPRPVSILGLLLAGAAASCMSYPDLVASDVEPSARDATATPERPAQAVSLPDDGGADAGVDAAAPPAPPGDDAGADEPDPPAKPCPECPPGTRCCAKTSKGKGKGDDVEIVCKAATAACDDDDDDDDDD